MKLVELSTILQTYCHEGKSLNKIVILYEDNHLTLDSVQTEKTSKEEKVIIRLKKESAKPN